LFSGIAGFRCDALPHGVRWQLWGNCITRGITGREKRKGKRGTLALCLLAVPE